MYQVGDRVSHMSRGEGVVISIPGMAEYDNEGYMDSSRGVVVLVDNSSRKYWCHIDNLLLLPRKVPDWEV